MTSHVRVSIVGWTNERYVVCRRPCLTPVLGPTVICCTTRLSRALRRYYISPSSCLQHIEQHSIAISACSLLPGLPHPNPSPLSSGPAWQSFSSSSSVVPFSFYHLLVTTSGHVCNCIVIHPESMTQPPQSSPRQDVLQLLYSCSFSYFFITDRVDDLCMWHPGFFSAICDELLPVSDSY